ncbi:hypothetical protein CBS101457_003210 [Exobasidium rhododendri]|nr:hypothetical protein CBS101457_003210 [Exobasidium rhododendri]
MVVAATDFYRALSDPLQAVQELYEKEGDKPNFSSLVSTHFRSLFSDSEARAKIAPLTRSLLSVTPPADSGPSKQACRLVRWRCMIQDTSMGSELMPRRFKTPEGSWKNGLFGAASLVDDQIDGEPDVSPNQLGSLTTLFAVSLPGQTKWSERMEDDLVGSVAGDLASKMDLNGASQRAATEGSTVLKSKLPTGSETGVLLKVYDEDLAESVRVAQAVDVIGILDESSLPSTDWSGEAVAGGGETGDLYPALHVITMQRADMHWFDPLDEGKEAEIRDALIQYLAQGLQGDRIAAEWLLLSLIAKIHTRTTSHILGPLSLNISSYRASSEGPTLLSLLSDILPLVVNQSLDLKHLNDKGTSFAPKSQADEFGLQAGRLQLVDGTLLFIDENTMQEGQLKEVGIENIRSLSSLLTSRKLAYTFPFSNLEMETDISCVVLSQGKSFLPLDVQLPLRPQQSPSGSKHGGRSATASSSSQQAAFTVSDYRQYLSSVQTQSSLSKHFSITSEISEKIQNDFVQVRNAKKESGGGSEGSRSGKLASGMESQEDFSRTIHIARLLCISRGQRQLSWQDWEHAKSLEAERSSRLL